MPKLICTQPEFQEQSCELSEGSLTVGRSHRNRIIIKDDSVSMHHCELLVHGPEIIVRECGSRNGTFVSGVRIQAQSGVKHGQKIRFGRFEVRLELDPPEFEDSTNITALTSLRSFLRDAAIPPRESPQFPVLFVPRKIVSVDDSTVSLPLPTEPSTSPSTHLPSNGNSNSKLQMAAWMWLAGGASVALLIVLWLWKR